MRNKLKIICTLTLLSAVGNVLAAASPSAVEGISASATHSEVTVTWDSVTSDPIAYYRVYYSAQSILENNGLFDDFETTEGNETTLTFSAPSDVDELFIAAIAVSEEGLESEFFTTEAYVEISNTPVPTAIPTPTPTAQPTNTLPTPSEEQSVRLLKAEVTSPTTIVTTFSSPITVEEARAPEGLKIENAKGELLHIKSITIDRSTITITTVVQTKGAVYNVQFSEPFMGKNGQALDASDRAALVSGHSEGKEPPAKDPARVVDPVSPPDITDVQLVPQIQENGGYTVTMEWTVDNTPRDLYGIIVYQTRDGQTFGPPSLLPIDIGGVQLQNVTPGFFGLYIQTINTYGYVSPGIFQYTNLPQYIPGYGFQGDLTFGSMDSERKILFNDMNNNEKEDVPENIATIEVITKDTPLQKIEGVDHSAAVEEFNGIHWQNAAILAGGSSIVILIIISAFIFLSKHNTSSSLV
ncbi:hypothetical protein COU75_01130 [Candidatus Peregrinibacteria bacterium CG10_big_fil_rev_8_21_14_0_10_42_8]|nr:MAG: hypothetical protein COU75_01130 [Candidatus Peregrinibacteria bacterium CG10_big_fil_rev_8_21_14_0_10_42_8]